LGIGINENEFKKTLVEKLKLPICRKDKKGKYHVNKYLMYNTVQYINNAIDDDEIFCLKWIYDIYDDNYDDLNFLKMLLTIALHANWKDEIRSVILLWQERTGQRETIIFIHHTTIYFLKSLSDRHEYLKSTDPSSVRPEAYEIIKDDRILNLFTGILTDCGECYPSRIY
jgi:hypothetical protein